LNPFCHRSGIRLCVICPWQQILQLAHGLGTSMHARGCSDSTSRGSPRSRGAPAAAMQRAARCSENIPNIQTICCGLNVAARSKNENRSYSYFGPARWPWPLPPPTTPHTHPHVRSCTCTHSLSAPLLLQFLHMVPSGPQHNLLRSPEPRHAHVRSCTCTHSLIAPLLLQFRQMVFNGIVHLLS
jgi:hypothetical protein